MTVIANIDCERVRNKMSQEQLCKELGVTRKTYQNWKARDNMPCNILIKCMRLFNCSADYLVRDVDSEPIECVN
jgi:transcriptional regulator with XRE-family HTH domain